MLESSELCIYEDWFCRVCRASRTITNAILPDQPPNANPDLKTDGGLMKHSARRLRSTTSAPCRDNKQSDM